MPTHLPPRSNPPSSGHGGRATTLPPYDVRRGSVFLFVLTALGMPLAGTITIAAPRDDFATVVRPLLVKYCVGCHSSKGKDGGLDLERFATAADVGRDAKPWQQVVEQLDAGEMPPKGKPQPTAGERKRLVAWTRGFLDAEARARSGDPGHVPLRRLGNAEYDNTVRDLTGVDMRPTREFPADGAGGEGFANAAEALTDVSPALFAKYLDAAKGIAAHAVLLPDGFRFSPSTARRDWTDEGTARLRAFYAGFAPADGRLNHQPYLLAAVRHRDALLGMKAKPEEVAAREKLNAKYFGVVWQALNGDAASAPLDAIRVKWKAAAETDVPALAKEVEAWQGKLWKTAKVGSYVRPEGKAYLENHSRQFAVDPPGTDAAGNAAFRSVFPLFLCFPPVVPTDEVVCLKMFHREDEPLTRLFLDGGAQRTLDKLWAEHRLVSRQAVAENDYLPQFIGFVTQDQPKAMELFFRVLVPAFKARADDLVKDEATAVPRQLEALLEFAARAYRRPLTAKEAADLPALYRAIRGKGAGHDEAFRGVLARVFVAPTFLFRVEAAPPGKEPAPVSDWELASRLSFFLWSSGPDDELRSLAAAGKLRDPKALAAQVERMAKDDRLHGLAVEFGTQWLHVRGFDGFKEKNESLFPAFNAEMRKAMNEEAVLFFQDLFRHDRPVTDVLDSDATYLNETLARHYGIPGVTGPQFRRVEGVQKYGRGGVLGLGAVQAKQAGASRTSPVLRGNWVVETLLGEKLPRPPKDVPQLPETEVDGLTVRQQVERHAKVASCAACHVRIDPFGFALEKYDAVGRLRSGPADTKATLKDGTSFDGIDGLRAYLLTRKKDVVVRLFCRRLLGYALGRGVTLSDTALIDDMVKELDANGGRVSATVQAIVRSPQFRMVRGRDMIGEE